MYQTINFLFPCEVLDFGDATEHNTKYNKLCAIVDTATSPSVQTDLRIRIRFRMNLWSWRLQHSGIRAVCGKRTATHFIKSAARGVISTTQWNKTRQNLIVSLKSAYTFVMAWYVTWSPHKRFHLPTNFTVCGNKLRAYSMIQNTWKILCFSNQ